MTAEDRNEPSLPQRIVTIMPDGGTRVGLPPWPKEVQELAFELWWLKFHRSARKVCDYLNGLPDQDRDHPADDLLIEKRDEVIEALSERKIAVATVYAWSKRGRWAEEVDKRHRQIAPALFGQVDQDLELASIEAAHTLIRLATDKSVPPKIQADAANSILDRTGHTAYVRPNDDGKIAGPQRDYSGQIAGKSTEELLAELIAGPSPDTD